jgi:hypothetical protein
MKLILSVAFLASPSLPLQTHKTTTLTKHHSIFNSINKKKKLEKDGMELYHLLYTLFSCNQTKNLFPKRSSRM